MGHPHHLVGGFECLLLLEKKKIHKIKYIYIYIVYKIKKYDSTGLEHNYLFSCGMGDNHRGICFLKDEKRCRGKPAHMNNSNFPTSYYNTCRKDKWNVVCVVYDINAGKSSLRVNHGKICVFASHLP